VKHIGRRRPEQGSVLPGLLQDGDNHTGELRVRRRCEKEHQVGDLLAPPELPLQVRDQLLRGLAGVCLGCRCRNEFHAGFPARSGVSGECSPGKTRGGSLRFPGALRGFRAWGPGRFRPGGGTSPIRTFPGGEWLDSGPGRWRYSARAPQLRHLQGQFAAAHDRRRRCRPASPPTWPRATIPRRPGWMSTRTRAGRSGDQQ
jgi:hypothetical protein